jgi:hypothetical protein
MSRHWILLLAAAVLLTSLACGVTINLPVDRIVTGPTQTEEISIRPAAAKIVDLTLNFEAGELKIQPAEQADLVHGMAKYNVQDFKPEITVEDQAVKISTGNLNIEGIPTWDSEVVNQWDLDLGLQPMNLEINSGAYTGDFELGGMRLSSLEVTDGAAEVQLRFSSPNLVEMETLRYQTGASDVTLSGLANANFTSMIFRSGAGNYKLDFSGDLQRDAVVTVESGFSQVVIVVPEGTTASVITDGGLMNVESSGGWVKSGDNYSLGSGGPELTINVDMGAGSLQLRTK